MQNTVSIINFFVQDFDKKILKNLNNKLKNDIWVNGKYVSKIERELAKYLKTNKKICSCNSGSDALLLALLLDKHPKKNIYLTTSFSYIASSSIAKFLNLKIIYIDVSKDNYLLDINKLRDFLSNCSIKIRNKIRGIINVELFGQTNELSELKKIAKKYGLSLIGDCAQSFGTIYKKKSTVNYYDYSTMSFYPTKVFSCYGDGGALLINKNKIKKANLLKNNGHEIYDKEKCKILGINSRLDNIQAYILYEKLKKLRLDMKIRKYNAEFLKINNPSFLKLPKFHKNVLSNNYIYSVYINRNIREKFIKYMQKNKIQCSIFYKKLLNESDILKPVIKTTLKNGIVCSNSLVCIPSHSNINKKEIARISKVINNFNYK